MAPTTNPWVLLAAALCVLVTMTLPVGSVPAGIEYCSGQVRRLTKCDEATNGYCWYHPDKIDVEGHLTCIPNCADNIDPDILLYTTGFSSAQNVSWAGYTQEVTCDPGYSTEDGTGSITVRCGCFGNWTDPNIRCKPDCGDPAGLFADTSLLSSSGQLEDDIATFQCQSPYTGVLTSECQSDGNWSTDGQSCDKQCVGVLPTVVNGGVEGNSGNGVGNTQKFKCDTGFSPYGDLTTTCNSDGTWSQPTGGCHPDCPGIQQSDLDQYNGVPWQSASRRRRSTHTVTYSFGTTQVFDCDEQYQGCLHATCQTDGTWDFEGECVWDCYEPVIPEYSTFEWSINNSVDDTLPGDEITITCNGGFSVTTLTCTPGADNDGWGPFPVCSADCSSPVQVDGFNLVAPANLQFGAVATYTCKWNASIVFIATCDSGGSFTGTPTPGDCVYDCEDFSTVQYSDYADIATANAVSPTTAGATVTVTCNDGVDSFDVTCDTGCGWTGYQTCDAECVTPPTNNHWTFPANMQATYDSQDTLTINCSATGVTNRVIKCVNGVWTNLPDCDSCPHKCSELNDPNEYARFPDNSNNYEGAEIFLECSNGLRYSRVCTIDGWSEDFDCPDACSPDTTPDNWVIDGTPITSAESGTTVDYNCPSTDTQSSRCCKDGAWEGKLDTCPDECTSPTVGDNWALADGESIPTTATDGKTVEYACASTAQTGDIVCVGGTWIYSLGVCPDECISPTVGDNWVLADGESIPTTATDGKTVEYECASTAQTGDIVCFGGTWIYSIGVCPDECISPTVGDNWVLADGESIPTTATDGKTVEYECASTAQTGDIVCFGGTWIYSLGVCPDECISPTVGDNWVLADGESIPTTATDGKTVEYECASTAQTGDIVCFGGTWIYSLGVCPDECISPTVGDYWVLADGESIPTTATDGKTVEYECASTAQTGDIVCFGGTWIYSLGVCPDECGDPTPATNWVQSGDTPTSPTDGKAVSFACASTEETHVQVCSSGAYNGDFPNCPNECATPSAPGNWALSGTPSTTATDGIVATFSCASTGENAEQVCCGGVWKGTLHNCPDGCGPITTTDLTGTNAQLPNPNSGEAHGISVVLDCNTNHAGCVVAACDNGAWKITGTCSASTTCGSNLPTVDNSDGHGSVAAQSAAGTKVTVSCQYADDTETVCTDGGSWSNAYCPPGCTAPVQADHPHWTFTTNKPVYSNGNTITWSCGSATQVITCVNGCWTNIPSFDSCPDECGPLSPATNWVLTGATPTSPTDGKVASFSCASTGKTNEQVCCDGAWKGDFHNCPNECGLPPTQTNWVVTVAAPTSQTDGEEVTFFCGSTGETGKLVCVNGVWKGKLCSCPSGCGPITTNDLTGTNAQLPDPNSGKAHGTIVGLTCNTNHAGCVEAECENGAWTVRGTCSSSTTCSSTALPTDTNSDEHDAVDTESPVGKKVAFSCKFGDNTESVCTEGGTWSAASCPPGCDAPVQADHPHWTFTTDKLVYSNGNTITWSCGSATQVITCVNGCWTNIPSFDSCPYDCGPLGDPNEQSRSPPLSNSEGTIVYLVCPNGFAYTRVCTAAGWSTGVTCDANCAAIPKSDLTIRNAWIDGSNVEVVSGTAVTLECKAHYKDCMYAQCKDGTWQYTGSCDYYCGVPPKIEFSAWDYIDQDGNGATIVVDCNGDGVDFTMVCDESTGTGNWGGAGVCKSDCLYAPLLIDSYDAPTFDPLPVPSGDTADYYCASLNETHTAICENGEWSTTGVMCPNDCGALSVSNSVSIVPSDQTLLDHEVTVTCLDGSTHTVTCDDCGWRGTPTCDADCDPIESNDFTGSNANVDPSYANTVEHSGTIVTLTCNDLYEGCAVLECNDGTWDLKKSCDPATTCSASDLPAVALSDSSDFSGDTESAVGTLVTFVCTYGGTAEIACKSNGTWSAATCKAADSCCGFPDIDYSTGNTWNQAESSPSGTTVTVSCADGGDIEVTCDAGEWSDDTCGIQCSEPDEVLYSSGNDWASTTGFAGIGDVVVYTCNSGSTVSRTCQADGTWTAAVCEPKCGDPPLLNDPSYVISSKPPVDPIDAPTAGQTYFDGKSFYYYCADDTVLWGDGPDYQSSTCTDGAWSEPPIRCVRYDIPCVNSQTGDVWTGRPSDNGFILLDDICWYGTQSSDTLTGTKDYCLIAGSGVNPDDVFYAQAKNSFQAKWFMNYARAVTGSDLYWTFMVFLGSAWVDPFSGDPVYVGDEFDSPGPYTEGYCGRFDANVFREYWEERRCSEINDKEKAICGIRMGTKVP